MDGRRIDHARRRPEEQAIDEREHRGIRADTECKRERDADREGRGSAKRADRVRCILPCRLERRPEPDSPFAYRSVKTVLHAGAWTDRTRAARLGHRPRRSSGSSAYEGQIHAVESKWILVAQTSIEERLLREQSRSAIRRVLHRKMPALFGICGLNRFCRKETDAASDTLAEGALRMRLDAGGTNPHRRSRARATERPARTGDAILPARNRRRR
jgi:hypothetical protein